MAEISQNVNIEMLEKLPDGTYKRKYPKTRADDGTTFDEHLAESTQQAHMAKNIGLEDAEGKFTATELEGAMSELFTNVSNGKDLVGGAITGVDDSVVIPADPTFNDLANAVGSISTGKKWASGNVTSSNFFREFELAESTQKVNRYHITVEGIDFTPSTIVAYTKYGYDPSVSVFSTINPYLSPTKTVQLTRLRGASPNLANMKANVSTAYINASGFRIPVNNDGERYEWIAFE